MSRAFDAPRATIFEMWTNPIHLPHWLLGPDGWTMPVCEIDLRPGGKWRYLWRSLNGKEEFGFHGEFREVVRPERLVNTESMIGQPGEAIVTVEFTEAGGLTTLTWTERFTDKATRDMVLATGMADGVTRSYERLDDYLRSNG